jgi:hypothetical protein
MTQPWGKTIGLFECSRPKAHEAGAHGDASEYRRRDPKGSSLYQAIEAGLPSLLQELQAHDKTLPFHVAREFEEFQKCGVLEHGLIRVKCTQCRHEKILGFSCKRRGFCASCAGKRMVESGVFLSEAVFPGNAPVRQWVVSVPIPLRYWMSVNSELMGQVNSIITRAIGAHYKKSVRNFLLEGEELQTAAVSVIQRFGGALNLNIHFHQLWVDGAYAGAEDEKTGHIQVHLLKSKEPTAEGINATLSSIQKRIVRLLMRRGLLNADGSRGEVGTGVDEGSQDADDSIRELSVASVQSRIATGEHQGQRVRRVGSFGMGGERVTTSGRLCAELGGFSLHAAVRVGAREKWRNGEKELHEKRQQKLEKLCRYVMRGAVAENRLFLEENGEVSYLLKTPWSDGTMAVQFTPLEFVEKLAALVPPPRVHQIRYQGVFAPNHSWREAVVPARANKSSVTSGELKTPISQGRRMSWAECLKRTFQVDLTQCPDCAGEVRFVAAIVKREVIRAILSHLKLEEFAADEGSQLPAPGFIPLVRGPPVSEVAELSSWDEHCQIPQYSTDF